MADTGTRRQRLKNFEVCERVYPAKKPESARFLLLVPTSASNTIFGWDLAAVDAIRAEGCLSVVKQLLLPLAEPTTVSLTLHTGDR